MTMTGTTSRSRDPRPRGKIERASNDIQLIYSRYQPSASCLVCGSAIAEGEGVTARYNGRVVRFKCLGCFGRFGTTPDAYLAGHAASCCEDQAVSPASEWCD